MPSFGFPARYNEGPTNIVRRVHFDNGRQSIKTGTDLAAGTQGAVVFSIPAGEVWELNSIAFTLVTDATVANRFVFFTIDDSATVWGEFLSTTSFQTASTTTRYSFAKQGTGLAAIVAPSATTQRAYGPLPMDLILFEGYQVRLNCTNMQAGDNFGPPTANVTVYPADPVY